MAAHEHLKNEFTEDKKYHNFVSQLNYRCNVSVFMLMSKGLCCFILDAILTVCVPFIFGVMRRMWNYRINPKKSDTQKLL